MTSELTAEARFRVPRSAGQSIFHDGRNGMALQSFECVDERGLSFKRTHCYRGAHLIAAHILLYRGNPFDVAGAISLE
jgi:hypothetical protein